MFQQVALSPEYLKTLVNKLSTLADLLLDLAHIVDKFARKEENASSKLKKALQRVVTIFEIFLEYKIQTFSSSVGETTSTHQTEGIWTMIRIKKEVRECSPWKLTEVVSRLDSLFLVWCCYWFFGVNLFYLMLLVFSRICFFSNSEN